MVLEIFSWPNLSERLFSRMWGSNPATVHIQGGLHTRPTHIPSSYRVRPFGVVGAGMSQTRLPTQSLKFRHSKHRLSHYLGSKKQRRWSDCPDAKADLCLFVVNVWHKTGFLMMWLKWMSQSFHKTDQLDLKTQSKQTLKSFLLNNQLIFFRSKKQANNTSLWTASRENLSLGFFWPGKTQTGLHSHRS